MFQVSPPTVGGFGTAHPFAHLALTAAVNPHCLEVARLLVAERRVHVQIHVPSSHEIINKRGPEQVFNIF